MLFISNCLSPHFFGVLKIPIKLPIDQIMKLFLFVNIIAIL